MLASRLDHRCCRSLLRSPAILAALVWLATCGTAFALVDVRDETWTLPAAVPGRASVTFTADVSANDLSSGVHFTIALRTEDTSPRALVHYATSAVTNLPGAGEFVTVHVVFDLDCNATTGVVRGIPVEATASFCVQGSGRQWNPLPGTPQADSTTVSATFGLAVLDENATAGTSPTHLDALRCGGPTAPAALSPAAPTARFQPVQILTGDTGASIGIYFDPEGTRCQGTIAPGGIDTVYVLAKLGTTDDSFCGIQGAEFRFAGIPSQWHTSPVTNPDLLAIGNPFTEGVTVVGSKCLRPANGVVLLFTALVLADALVPNVTFTIENRQPPTNALFPCPFVLACDDPIFTKFCVQTQPCFVNPTMARSCTVPTAVSSTSWSLLKNLYR